MLANKRKSPHFIEGFKTWCGLLCDYRTQISEELKEKLQKGIDDIKENRVYSLDEAFAKIDNI